MIQLMKLMIKLKATKTNFISPFKILEEIKIPISILYKLTKESKLTPRRRIEIIKVIPIKMDITLYNA